VCLRVARVSPQRFLIRGHRFLPLAFSGQDQTLGEIVLGSHTERVYPIQATFDTFRLFLTLSTPSAARAVLSARINSAREVTRPSSVTQPSCAMTVIFSMSNAFVA